MVNPEVLQLRASQNNADTEPHIQWHVSYSPTPVTGSDRGGPERTLYPVIGTLHVGGPSGWGDISVGALMMALSDLEQDGGLKPALERTEAIEALYDVARGHLGPLLRTIDCLEELPKRSPKVLVEEFDRSGEGDGTTSKRRRRAPVAEGDAQE